MTVAARPSSPAAPADDWMRRHVVDNPHVADHRDLFLRWFDTTADRERVAAAEGLPLGRLLYIFNDTAPLGRPLPYRYGGIAFEVVPMAGVCDDVAGDRYGRFGEPATLRFYLTEPDVLPSDMFEVADWNFMDAGRPGYVGYAYGSVIGPALYLSGIQSDLAVRYSYLFQAKAATTHVRTGLEVAERPAAELAARFGGAVPTLRRVFQRRWIDVALGGIMRFCRAAGLTEVGIHQFPLDDAERAPGSVMQRVYRLLPDRLGSARRELSGQRYLVASLDRIERHLGDAYEPGDDER